MKVEIIAPEVFEVISQGVLSKAGLPTKRGPKPIMLELDEVNRATMVTLEKGRIVKIHEEPRARGFVQYGRKGKRATAQRTTKQTPTEQST